MMSSPAPHLLLVTLLLVTGPGDRGGVEGGALTTPACIAACMMGPCAGVSVCEYWKKYFKCQPRNSVADPGCFSQIPDPDFLPIPDPRSKNLNKSERGVKKNLLSYLFFVATNFTKFKIIIFLKCGRKKMLPSFQRIIELFTQKFVTKL
jgi:hypothetical protein